MFYLSSRNSVIAALIRKLTVKKLIIALIIIGFGVLLYITDLSSLRLSQRGKLLQSNTGSNKKIQSNFDQCWTILTNSISSD